MKMKLTREQRKALKAVYDRQPLYRTITKMPGDCVATITVTTNKTPFIATYKQFRKTVQPGSGCIMVPWCNMWLGIEPDGYTHS